MNQRGGERQQTEGPTAEQHSAKHPAAGRQKKKKNLHHNSHNPQFLQQESLKEENRHRHSKTFISWYKDN